MPLYTTVITSISNAEYYASVQAVSYPIRPVRVNAYVQTAAWKNSGDLEITAFLNAYRTTSPSYSGATTFTPAPLRGGSVSASAVFRGGGTHNGTKVSLDFQEQYQHQYVFSGYISISQLYKMTVDLAGDVLIAPGEAFTFRAARTGSDNPSGSIHLVCTFEEIRQLSWPS